mgnify:CR=1 FL=1
MIHFYTANLTLRTVRAGHARLAGLPLHPVHLNPVGEGFIPHAHPAYTTNLTHHHPVGAGHARPATYPILQLVANAQQIPNMHLAQKSLSKFGEKIKNNP